MKASPFHALIVLGKKRLSILASCMANLSNFHVVFSSSTLIRRNKDAFEGHLCQTVNDFIKQHKSSLLSPLRKRRPPQQIRHIRNTRVAGRVLIRGPISVLQILNFLAYLKWYGFEAFNIIPTMVKC